MFIVGDVDKAEDLLQSRVGFGIKRVLEYVHRNIMWNEQYVRSKQFNVAVCATMSAGKSTFINAMLGLDYIPAKNEACTAKITTIRDNDNLNKLIGCYTRVDNTKVYSNVIDAEILNTWNEDISVQETILEGDIEEVSCDDGVLVIHDTPGTNNSGDDSHHDKTIEFLKNNELNLVIYLINAEYISTNDTEILLKEIQEITKTRKTGIVFGLNKIDSFDIENESVENAIHGLCEQLKGYGFEKPVIFPFSANAARLFKLLLKGKELTKRERRSFDNLLEFFTTFDASKYVINAEGKNISASYSKLKKDKKIIIDEKEYMYNSIVNALEHTGILCIENWLENQLQYTSELG
jgi:predicted GTPase